MKVANRLCLVFALFGLLISNEAFAHANIVPKDNVDDFTGRNYKEGSTVFMQMSISHACFNEDRSESYNTKHVVSIMPTGVDLTGIAYTKDGHGNRYGGNAVMTIRPLVDSDWERINIKTGEVSTYYSHGVKTEDVAAIHWMNGNVPNEFQENLTFRVSLPKLEGCVTKLKVYMPTVQYCQKGKVMAWFLEGTPSIPEAENYAPFFYILRDLEANPLPDECGGVGVEEEVYPSEEDIEEGLLRKH